MTGSTGPQQLPLVLPHEEALGVDDYLVSTSNQAAFNLITNWPEWPSPIVTLQGPIGSGKTHLVNAWQELSGAQIVGGDELEFLDLTALAEAGPVAVEDLHAGFDEASLFHLFNAVRLSGGNMLMTTREWPNTFDLKTKDLASRFRAATPVQVEEPDDMLLAMVMTKHFSDRQVTVDSSVIDYLVIRIERSLDAARNVVDMLDRHALAKGRKISRVMASKILESMGE
ncbi:Chromosomal replication initiator protein DnaA [Pseudovibrio sp. Ad13]|uniref:DnaA ATPase domain-containing protein n=1 Tax=unclassified Pseudovibrio TaxID=2627060 RepID=UPI000708922E|nr:MULTISPECIES: DnaA/Hda family protein [unclassified Pseudovibrio]KZK82710.1 Chromosomal replication initiator protein DnaA [Pseudovibrio sp. Ad13]KZK85480.1 Chromosomal replication initiator protein DnaA [Pseudovibrio sp. Ad46]KZL02536.1 Chromosomal replication initiator protein DnaA [Pseudovibrio sp. W74]KZL07921.1 Chromosomal replication initiator protein DnaA [Pseudovibrio sp. Ad14]KZL26633.1 Chromosomal replication initiator protein DnaA [Pseudovibrio sp. WM33]